MPNKFQNYLKKNDTNGGWGKLDDVKQRKSKDMKQDLEYRININNASLPQYTDFLQRNSKIDMNTLPLNYLNDMRSQGDIENDELYQKDLLVTNCSKMFPSNNVRGNQLIQLLLNEDYDKYFNKFFAKIFRLVNTTHGINYFPPDVIALIKIEKAKDDKQEMNSLVNPSELYKTEALNAGTFIQGLFYIIKVLDEMIQRNENNNVNVQAILIDSKNKADAINATLNAMGSGGLSTPSTPAATPVKARKGKAATAASVQSLATAMGTTVSALNQNVQQFSSVLGSGQIPSQPFLQQVGRPTLNEAMKIAKQEEARVIFHDRMLDIQKRMNTYSDAVVRRTLNTTMNKSREELVKLQPHEQRALLDHEVDIYFQNYTPPNP